MGQRTLSYKYGNEVEQVDAVGDAERRFVLEARQAGPATGDHIITKVDYEDPEAVAAGEYVVHVTGGWPDDVSVARAAPVRTLMDPRQGLLQV